MTSTNPTAGYGQFASNNPPPHGGNQNREGWPQSNGGRTIIGNTQSAEDNSISVGARPSLEESGAVSRRPSLDNSSEATSANIQWVQTTSDAHLVQTSRPASPISTSSTRRSRFMLQSQAFGKEGQEIRPPARRSAYQRITDFVARFWLFEIASTTVSAAVLVAIAIILKDSDNHILSAGGEEPDNWFFGQLTLNGLVALLSTVVEACMMVSVAAGISQLKWIRFGVLRSTRSGRRMAEFDDMDQASKGARGSLKFLLSRIPQLASIGAVITIFALAFDTFSQQVIAIETAVGNITQPANIPGVASYSLYMKDGQENAFTAPLPVTAAAYNGVFDSGNISPSLAQCDTGNCTWPIFPSLAVDGSCANITDTVIHKCTPHDGAYNCTYNVTDGSGYTLVQDSTSPLGVGGDFGSEYRLIVSPTFTGSAYQDPRMLYILNLLVLDLRGGTGPQAYACGLWLSIHTYNLTMVSGKQTQTVTGTWNKTNYDTQRRVETEAWYSFTDLPASIMPPNVPQMNGSMGLGVQFSDPPTYNFSVYQFAYAGLGATFGLALNASVTYGADSYVEFSNDVALALWQVSSWDAWISGMAQSLTNGLQSTAMIVDQRYQKTVYTIYAFIHVRWAWLAFPTAMIAASALFLAASIFLTAHRGLQPWKDKCLRLLFVDLDKDIETQASTMHLLEDERVIFDRSTLGGVFRRVAPLPTNEPTSPAPFSGSSQPSD